MFTALLECLRTEAGSSFELIKRFSDEEKGPFLLRDQSGEAFILKWDPYPITLEGFKAAHLATDRLRGEGYPAPEYLSLSPTSQGCYALRRALPGEALQRIPLELLPRLLELNALQKAKASGRQDWPRPIIQMVVQERDAYGPLDSLRRYSSRSAQVFVELQECVVKEYGANSAPLVCPTNDIVHFDLHPGNILVENGHISGIIDWEQTRVGDCAFDLVTLWFYAYNSSAVRSSLWDILLERSSLKAIKLYLAYIMIRQIDWAIRRYPSTVERWLAVADEVIGVLYR